MVQTKVCVCLKISCEVILWPPNLKCVVPYMFCSYYYTYHDMYNQNNQSSLEHKILGALHGISYTFQCCLQEKG